MNILVKIQVNALWGARSRISIAPVRGHSHRPQVLSSESIRAMAGRSVASAFAVRRRRSRGLTAPGAPIAAGQPCWSIGNGRGESGRSVGSARCASLQPIAAHELRLRGRSSHQGRMSRGPGGVCVVEDKCCNPVQQRPDKVATPAVHGRAPRAASLRGGIRRPACERSCHPSAGETYAASVKAECKGRLVVGRRGNLSIA
jgi:hypothetical protein